MPFIRSCWQQIAGSPFTNCQVAFFAKLEAIFTQKRFNHRKNREGGKNFNLSIISFRQVYFANLIRADNTQAVPGENTCYFYKIIFRKWYRFLPVCFLIYREHLILNTTPTLLGKYIISCRNNPGVETAFINERAMSSARSVWRGNA